MLIYTTRDSLLIMLALFTGIYPNLPKCAIVCLSLLFIDGEATMKIKRFLIDFLIVFTVAFVVNLIVVFLWNLIFHGQGSFEWETALRFAIILGIILPSIGATKWGK